jgi:hypothetical protein
MQRRKFTREFKLEAVKLNYMASQTSRHGRAWLTCGAEIISRPYRDCHSKSANHALHSFCDRLQKVQRDFRRTIETRGNDGTPSANGPALGTAAKGTRFTATRREGVRLR